MHNFPRQSTVATKVRSLIEIFVTNGLMADGRPSMSRTVTAPKRRVSFIAKSAKFNER